MLSHTVRSLASHCQFSHSVKLCPPQADLDTLCSYPVCTRRTLQRNDTLRDCVSEPVISHGWSRRLLLGNPKMYLSSWPFCLGFVLPSCGTVLRCAALLRHSVALYSVSLHIYLYSWFRKTNGRSPVT
jgi:hypothetical protein